MILLAVVPDAEARFREQSPIEWRTFEVPDSERQSNDPVGTVADPARYGDIITKFSGHAVTF
jgi:hypothetical protein